VEWNTLDKMFNLLSEQLPVIKQIIVIDATPNELLQNLHKRNRNLYSNTQLDYLSKLKECFDENKILFDISTIIFNIPELMTDNQNVIEKLNQHIIDS
jgi:deoxyadenosine/deoxycytidine kinase